MSITFVTAIYKFAESQLLFTGFFLQPFLTFSIWVVTQKRDEACWSLCWPGKAVGAQLISRGKVHWSGESQWWPPKIWRGNRCVEMAEEGMYPFLFRQLEKRWFWWVFSWWKLTATCFPGSCFFSFRVMMFLELWRWCWSRCSFDGDVLMISFLGEAIKTLKVASNKLPSQKWMQGSFGQKGDHIILLYIYLCIKKHVCSCPFHPKNTHREREDFVFGHQNTRVEETVKFPFLVPPVSTGRWNAENKNNCAWKTWESTIILRQLDCWL